MGYRSENDPGNANADTWQPFYVILMNSEPQTRPPVITLVSQANLESSGLKMEVTDEASKLCV